MRKCLKCGQDKEIEAFECTNQERGWRRRECKTCVRDRVRGYAADSRTKIQEYRQAYHSKHRDKIIAKVNEWVQNNPGRRRKNALAYYYRLQHAAIEAYGGYRCTWCGINEPLVLCIDHVANDGRTHRKEVGSVGGHRFYKWLRDNSYPDGFQVLCMNCNHAKYRNGGVIPQTLHGRCNDHPAME